MVADRCRDRLRKASVRVGNSATSQHKRQQKALSPAPGQASHVLELPQFCNALTSPFFNFVRVTPAQSLLPSTSISPTPEACLVFLPLRRWIPVISRQLHVQESRSTNRYICTGDMLETSGGRSAWTPVRLCTMQEPVQILHYRLGSPLDRGRVARSSVIRSPL